MGSDRTAAAERGQVAASAADVYEEFFVPALFAQATPWVLDAAEVGRGDRVVDVACGTGVLARAAADRVGPGGHVVGVDVNAGMLAVARRVDDRPTWCEGAAEALPLADGSVDAAVSQFGLMFVQDRVAALRELARVAVTGGRVAVAVWGALGDTPGYDAMASLLGSVIGSDAVASLTTPYSLGDRDHLRTLAATAGLPDVAVTSHVGTARFASLDAWIHTDIRGWTLADSVDDEQVARLRTKATTALASFVAADGTVEFQTPAFVLHGVA